MLFCKDLYLLIVLSLHMSEPVAPHAHCQVCGKSIPVSERVCSPDCQQRYQQMVKRRKMTIGVMWALIVIMLLVYLFIGGIF